MSKSYNAALVNKILSDFTKGYKIQSLNKLEKYLNDNPKDLTARYNYGYMCQQCNKIDIAKKNYLKVISKDPEHWRSKFNIYTIYIAEKSYSLALKYLEEVLRIKKNYQPAQRDKALILYYMKKPDEALKHVVLSIKQNALDYLAFNTLGLILISLNKYDEAKKAFLEGIKIEPKYIASYNNLGHCYTLVNEKDNALKIFKKGLSIDPSSPEVINNLANYYNNNGEYEKALKYYFNALKSDKNNSSIISNVAIAYFNLGNNNKAEKFCKKAYLLNPNDDLIKKAYSMKFNDVRKIPQIS